MGAAAAHRVEPTAPRMTSALGSWYQIDHDGQQYFGNVVLREFYQFRHEGQHYLFNVATMTPHQITEPVARLVDNVASALGSGLISGQAMAALRRLGLVAGDAPLPTPAADGTPADGETTAVAGAPDYGIASMALFVAQQCNMACVYCYGQAGEYADKGMMTPATAFKAVDWLLANSGRLESVHVSFFGGEPMMNFPLIKKVVDYAKQAAQQCGKQVTFGMTTNASLLTDQRIAYLREHAIVPIISFDGPAHIQNRQRPFSNGKGSYNKVQANLQKLHKVFPLTLARATLHGDADPADIRAGLAQAGFQSFAIAKASPVILDGDPTSPDQDPRDARLLAMELDMAQALRRDIKARQVNAGAASNGKVAQLLGQLMVGGKRQYHCGVGRSMVAITTAGDIYPCHRFAGQADMKMGHIDSYRFDRINDYHRAAVDNLPQCRSCWVRYACSGGCFYDNKAARGDVRLPDHAHCRETRALMEAAIVLLLQLDDEDKTYVRDCLKIAA